MVIMNSSAIQTIKSDQKELEAYLNSLPSVLETVFSDPDIDDMHLVASVDLMKLVRAAIKEGLHRKKPASFLQVCEALSKKIS